MEFYFSEANLHKDRFLKQQLQQTSDGYVDLEMFLRFNKIRALVDNTALLAKALSKSEVLQVNEDKTKVRRTKPLEEPTDVDERTVYVECLPAGVNHDWVRNKFAKCGQVVYVSLPKYKSTGDIKGFAFVEFDTMDAARAACLTMNSPPATVAAVQPGRFPKSRQLKTVERQMESCHSRKRRASESVAESCEEAPTAKRRRTFSEGEKPWLSKHEQHIKPQAERSAESSDVKSECTVKTDDVSERTKPDRKRVVSDEQVSGRKDRKRKRSSIQSVGEQDSERGSVATKAAKAGDKNAKKSKVSGQDADTVPRHSSKRSLQGSAEDLNQSLKKQKCANKSKKEQKCKHKQKAEPLQLRVISKSQWLELRSEYLRLQKANVAQLKSSLKALKETNTNQPADVNGDTTTVSNLPVKSVESKSAEASSLVFTPSVIIHISSNGPLSRSELKTRLSPLGSIAYIDVQDGDHTGHIRCSDASSAAEIVQAQMTDCSLQLLTGEPELCYWQKAAADRQKKHSSQTSRTSRRGRDKILKKAEKFDASQRKHIVFDD